MTQSQLINIILWKYNASRNLKPTPVWYDLTRINASDGSADSINVLRDYFHNPETFNARPHFGGKYLTDASLEGYVPDNLQDILFFHGNCQKGIEKRNLSSIKTSNAGSDTFKDLFTQYLQEIVMII